MKSQQNHSNSKKYKIILWENWYNGRDLMQWYLTGIKLKNSIIFKSGFNFQSKQVIYNQGEEANVNFWRFIGSWRFEAFRRVFYDKAQAAIIFYSLIEPEQGFPYVEDRYREIRKNSGNIPILIIGTDMEKNHQVDSDFNQKIKNYAENDQCFYIQIRSDEIEGLSNGIKTFIQRIIINQEKQGI